MKNERKKILLIGAGQIGCRHLEALKKVSIPLDIAIVDPLKSSLIRASERYDAVVSDFAHRVSFNTSIPDSHKNTRIAVIATTSAHRKIAIDEIFNTGSTEYMFLEKLLFQKESDYSDVSSLINIKRIPTWVNCRMRIIPCYRDMKAKTNFIKIQYEVSAGDLGIATSAVHFLDHVAYLTGCTDFTIDTTELDEKPVESKRSGFVEFNGTLKADFKDGSTARITKSTDLNSPFIVKISTEDKQFTINETIQKMSISKKKGGWTSVETDAPIPYQSTMTTWLVEDILSSGNCTATPYEESAKIHLQTLEPLRQFLNQNGGNYDYFPFT